MKRGKLSEKEIEFISENLQTLPLEDIARRLDRNLETIRTYAAKLKVPEHLKDEDFKIAQTVKGSWAWKMLTEEFTLEEIKYFEEKYAILMAQFNRDVLPSEETQIWQAIKFEILMSRNLKARQQSLQDIKRLEQTAQNFLGGRRPGDLDEDERRDMMQTELAISSLRDSEQNRTTEYAKLHQEHCDLMKSLKAVRDQRIKTSENEKDNFLGVLKMMQDREKVEAEGRLLGLAKLATKKEQKRLGDLHTYMDGTIDRPILNSDTI